MKTYRFYKDEQEWFIDLPEWDGSIWELQMVAGADDFLNILAQGEDDVSLVLSKEQFNGADYLQYIEPGRLEGPEMGTGAWYFLGKYRKIDYKLRLWLCDVTRFVFGEFPDKIYFK